MFEIAGKFLSKYRDTFVIAEVASSHEGEKDVAIHLLNAALEAGADAVKFQIFSSSELLTPNHPKYEAFQIIEMSHSEWDEIISEAQRLNFPFIPEVFDEGSFHFVEKYDVAAYKIHSTDLNNPILLEKVARTQKPIFLSCGGSSFEEIRFAINQIEKFGNHQIVLLHGFQAFPTKLEDTFLVDLLKLEKEFGYPTGYADHCDAENELALILPMVTIGMGISVVEKHITPDRAKMGRDYYSALNPNEFSRMVDLIRDINISMRKRGSGFTEAELQYRQLMKKSIVARKDIAESEIIGLSHLAFKRAPEIGMQPREVNDLTARKANKVIEANDLIRKSDAV